MNERIDIEVIDKVAKTIKPELLGISAAAKNAYSQIAKLKKELGVTGGSGMAAATKAAANAEREATRASAERARQATATARAIDAERASMERLRAVAARASTTGVAAGSGANLGVAAGSRSTMAAQTAIMRQTSVANREVAATAKEAATAQNTFATSTAKAGQQAGLARHHLLNLGFQLQDIFVSLASGQKPLTVFIQQGGQIGQIAAQSGVGIGGMAKAIGSLLLRFAPITIAIGAAAAAFGIFNRAINKGVSVKELTQGLGASRRELYKLKDESITTGDTIKAVFQVVGQDIVNSFGISTKGIKSAWTSALDFLTTWAKKALAGIYTLFVGTFRSIGAIAKGVFAGKNWQDIMKDAVKAQTDTLSEAEKGLDKWFGRVQAQATKNARSRIAKELGYRKPEKHVKTDAERLAERQAEALRKLQAELDKEQGMLARNLVGVDATIAERMNSIADSLENVKIDIFAKKNEDLRNRIEKLVTAIEKEKVIVAAMQAQFQEASSVELDYANNVEALNRLIAKGGPYIDNYKRQMQIVTETYLDAIDPLRAFNRELDQQSSLLFKMGNAKSVQEYTNSIADAYRARGESIYQKNPANDNGDIVVNGARTLLPEVKAQVDAFADYLKEQRLSDIVGDIFSTANPTNGNQFILDNYKELYAAIDQMRTGDINSERQAARAKQELNQRYMEARLEGTRTVLDNLATLQDSHSRELAAIGKAAAVAQATIDGIVAVQKALASFPPPVNYIVAGAVGVAAAANVAKIAGVGFQKGGYTGDVPPHQSVGSVHGREYVMDAAATARIGVPTLDALRGGRLNPAPAANNNVPRVTIINNAGANVSATPNADGSIDVLVEAAVERKLGPTFQRRLSDPNSKESRAIGSSFKVRRNR